MSTTGVVHGSARVTILDVARQAGVSPATVSKVVNGRSGVATATSQRVHEVIADLGYETSLVAASMRRTSTHVVGILLAGFDPFATEVLKGISSTAVNRGYELLAYCGAVADDTEVGWERRSLLRLAGTLIDAAIVMTPTVVIPSTSIPVVTIDPRISHSWPMPPQAAMASAADTTSNAAVTANDAITSGAAATSGTAMTSDSMTASDTMVTVGHPQQAIFCDSFTGAMAATQHLIDLGHTRIAHLSGRSDLRSAHLREDGYRKAMDQAGIPINPQWVREGRYRRDDSEAIARQWLQSDTAPTAIFAANDSSALGVYDAARALGLRIPQDISVVGFDDIPEATAVEPQLTTVAQPLQQMGALAYNMIHAMLSPSHVTPLGASAALQAPHGQQTSATQDTLVPATLRVRGSTSAPLH